MRFNDQDDSYSFCVSLCFTKPVTWQQQNLYIIWKQHPGFNQKGFSTSCPSNHLCLSVMTIARRKTAHHLCGVSWKGLVWVLHKTCLISSSPPIEWGLLFSVSKKLARQSVWNDLLKDSELIGFRNRVLNLVTCLRWSPKITKPGDGFW